MANRRERDHHQVAHRRRPCGAGIDPVERESRRAEKRRQGREDEKFTGICAHLGVGRNEIDEGAAGEKKQREHG